MGWHGRYKKGSKKAWNTFVHQTEFLLIFFSDDHTSTIKKAFRHAHSYRGGGDYGTFGGHDIALLELDHPIVSQIACLPSPSYKDEGEGVIGSLAGIMLDLVKTRWS